MSANVQSMMYVGAKPWHNLGRAVQGLATSSEAISAAQLNWHVNLSPVYTMVAGGFNTIPGKFATTRSDDNSVLGVVGKNYTPVQNTEAFGFFDSVVGEGKAMYEVAGALGRGEQIWMLAKLPGDIVVGREDIVEKYLLLVNSHDGLSSLKMFFTPIRVVCQNTLSAALDQRKAGEGIMLRHHANIADKVREAQNVLGIANKKYDELGEQYDFLSKRNVDSQWITDYMRVCFPCVDESKVSSILTNTRRRVAELVESPSNLVLGARGTAWGAYNAVTEYVDHKGMRKGGETGRLRSIWMGNGAVVKENALNAALNMSK